MMKEEAPTVLVGVSAFHTLVSLLVPIDALQVPTCVMLRAMCAGPLLEHMNQSS